VDHMNSLCTSNTCSHDSTNVHVKVFFYIKVTNGEHIHNAVWKLSDRTFVGPREQLLCT
jgi:hypothetical protein